MQTVIGVFDDRSSAERAVTRLTETGFDRSDVHLEPAGAAATGTSTSTSTRLDSSGTERRADGDDKGMMESIGDFFANLFGSGVDSDPHRAHAGRYSEAVRRGSHVVVVDADDEDDAERAADVLNELGAVDIDERAEQWRATGWSGSSYADNDTATPYSGQQMMAAGASSSHPQVARLEQPPVGTPGSLLDIDRPALGSDPYGDDTRLNLRDTDATRGTGAGDGLSGTQGISARSDRDAPLQGERKLEVVQEELQVGKRTLDRGGVRVVQRVSEKPVREVVRLREEHAVVERRSVDREATPADFGTGQDVVVEVRETVEQPVVSKRAHVVEEVVVGKEVRERDETVNDSLRRKDVDVERLAGDDADAGRRNLEHAEARNPGTGLTGTRRSDGSLGTDREPKDLTERRKP